MPQTAAVSSNPYLQSMYAAAAAANAAAGNPYATSAGIPISAASSMIPMGAATAQNQFAGLSGVPAASGQSTGNPSLDAYLAQYSALAAAQGMYGTQAVAGNPSINGLDPSQAGKNIGFEPRHVILTTIFYIYDLIGKKFNYCFEYDLVNTRYL
jgi:hypothetical protein